MAGNILLEVVTPEKIVVSETVQTVTAPGSEGEFGVLVGHTPFLATLKLGTLNFKDETGKVRAVFINGGFAETLPNKVTVLAESAERRCDIDADRCRLALERAQQRLESKETAVDFERAKRALARAQTRMSLAESRKMDGFQ
ncbi:F0F1 ATP synthase subunit epsilon [Desulfatibacillum aliphaticivorans]|uniref:F0F1 ATP synthase subunit epsilon n=1 Tax=Desulfatibacillum aliphaticivorans TaxID=218208 RepID=UPI000481DC76|nr:F0F1 ATP synthase subunit epsilon [Desulfatibacillum aliphaticivorans]